MPFYFPISPPSPNNSSQRTLLATLILTSFLAGCGGSDNTEAPVSAVNTPATDTPAPTNTPTPLTPPAEPASNAIPPEANTTPTTPATPIASDTTPPKLALTLPDNLQENEPVVPQVRFTLTGTATDNEKVTVVQLRINGAAPIDLPLSGHDFTVPLALRAGSNEYTITARDAAGNETYHTGKIYVGHRIAAGVSYHGALVNGALYTWGDNGFKQLGIPQDNISEISTPTLIPTPAKFVSLAFTGTSSFAIDDQGQAWSWGESTSGELGRGSDQLIPCGDSNSCRADIGPIAELKNTVALEAGGAHALALTADGTVWAMGANHAGQLGDGTTDSRDRPTPVRWPEDAHVAPIAQIAASNTASFALDADGQLWAWGSNANGELGNGTISDLPNATPTRVPMPEGVQIVRIAAGGEHVLAQAQDGAIYAWGDNYFSQVGYRPEDAAPTSPEEDEDDTPPLPSDDDSSDAVDDDIDSPSSPSSGNTGDDDLDDLFGLFSLETSCLPAGMEAWPEIISSPRKLPGTYSAAPITHIYSRTTSSYLLDKNGNILQWGTYFTGAESIEPHSICQPTRIQDHLSNIAEIAQGAGTTLALRTDGQFFIWGWQARSALGTSPDTTPDYWQHNTPIPLQFNQ